MRHRILRGLVAGAVAAAAGMTWIGCRAPSAGESSAAASATAAAYPPRDVTMALRAAIWNSGDMSPEGAAAASYASRAEWLGVSYIIEGVFVGLPSQQIAQLEVISRLRSSRWHALSSARE